MKKQTQRLGELPMTKQELIDCLGIMTMKNQSNNFEGKYLPDIRNKIREVFLDKNALRVKLSLDNLRATHFVPVRDADYQIIRALP